ncbi:ABC transporter ATP-binding protein [Paenibacillus apiarius]|uniref:ABC transporter ATP-binding protein n=1 Tax=Paenibacillus apiarius TaxID=46240 RepID=UPI003B3BB0F4
MKKLKHFSETIKNIFVFLSYFWKLVWFRIVLMLGSKLVHALIPSVQLLITKELVDSINHIFQANGQSDAHIVYYYLAAQTGLLLLDKMITTIELINNAKMQQQINYEVEKRIVGKTSVISLSYFENSKFYDHLMRASSGQSQRVVEMLNGPLSMLQYIITFTTVVGILTTFHWLAGITVLLLAALPLVINAYIGKMRYSLLKEATPLSRRVQYYLNLLKGRDTAKEIRLFQLQDHLIQRWKQLFESYAKKMLSFEIKTNAYRFGIDGISAILISLNLAFIIWMGTKQKLSIGEYMAISQAFMMIQGVVLSIALSISSLYENSLQLRDLIDFLEYPLEIKPEDEPQGTEVAFPAMNDKGIKVENLQFSYEENGPIILDQISFQIEPGQKVAIVGNNGAGKSTLVKCLLGLYRSYKGSITYENVDLKHIPAKELMQHVSAVFQDFAKYELTARENIGFGRVEHLEMDDKMIAASMKGDSHSFISKLPCAYDTILGRSFYGGTELSGGQWQKIAISRAFFRDADIIILDEPAASLDPMAEANLYKTFAELSVGKTTIMISHRLSSCVNADLILVMKSGRIIEQGTHAELMRLNGEYADMFNIQAEGFQFAAVN